MQRRRRISSPGTWSRWRKRYSRRGCSTSSITQQMMRELSYGDKKSYTTLMKEEQQNFRRGWATKAFNKVTEK